MSKDSLERFIEQLERCELLPETTVRSLCESLRSQLLNEPNVLQLRAPISIVGDVHGQFHDLIELFRVCGRCPDTNYLFLGDYVDRGPFSVETLSLLVCLKLRWPERIHMLRGNHESRPITQVYGFYGECVRKYGSAVVWRLFTDLFDFLPIAAVVEQRIFAVHGGLSPAAEHIDQIRVLDRYREVPDDGIVSDLLWSDPELELSGFQLSQRGRGFVFGGDTVTKFCRMNGIQHIVRAHQLCMDGFQTLWENSFTTVWSAPNYCSRCGNIAAVMEVNDGGEWSFNTFIAAPESERNNPDFEAKKEVPDYFL